MFRVVLSLRATSLEVEKDDLIWGGEPHIYTLYYRKKGNAKDEAKSSAGPSDDSKCFPECS